MGFQTCYWTKAVTVREKTTQAHSLRHPTIRGGKKRKNQERRQKEQLQRWHKNQGSGILETTGIKYRETGEIKCSPCS